MDNKKLAEIRRCFQSFRGRSCGGCINERECGMLDQTTAYLLGSFIPSIDPGGQVYYIPEEAKEWARQKLEEINGVARQD